MSGFDVIVVGGGLMGCLSALRLAQHGQRVAVLERAVPGAEASSAAAGILAAQTESRAFGPLFELALESRDRYAALAEELRDRTGMDVGFRRTGALELAESSDALDALEREFAWQRDLGHPVERLDAESLRAHEPALGPSFAGAIAFPRDAQVDPAALVTAVAQAAERAGVTFVTGATVRGVRVESGVAVGVDTDADALSAGHVVIAAGAWSSLVRGANVSSDAVKPARGQIVELSLRTAPIARVVYGRGGYLVPRANGTVLCGSTLEFVGFQREVTAAGLTKILTMAVGLVPSLADASVRRTWANFRPWSSDGAPLVGDGGVRRLTIATGHYRSGILLAPATAERVRAHVIEGRVDRGGPWDPSRASLHVPQEARA